MPELESAWLILAQEGDSGAFAKVVEVHQSAVYNFCFRMLGDPYEAEDAAQETFIRAYKAIKSYDRTRSFSTWILSIAAHYCIDQLRRKKIQVTSMEDQPYLEIRDPGPNPESVLSMREDQQRIRSLLNVLSDTDRAAIIMFYWYEFSYEEIANSLGLSLSAVKSRLHRARARLAKTWSERKGSVFGLERQTYGSPAV